MWVKGFIFENRNMKKKKKKIEIWMLRKMA